MSMTQDITTTPTSAPGTRNQQTSASEGTLLLQGMTCAACAARIERSLKKMPGVETAAVNLATERGAKTCTTSRPSCCWALSSPFP